ncbi:hypothetical protein EXU30_04740 [Shewanella maritima]|uniref:Uncharacterized protein n=1 Tax=Shewanella maritima TaxID=2520507 RepID=A0A411PET3_9GAMM|nr:hypothetical protein [Shewanella maritima]QBF82089.1 hypothetical protein EXU30_04740 [Shewanella maritima]
MSFDIKSIEPLIHSFFGFIQEEEFEKCFHWAKTELQATKSSALSMVESIETTPKIELKHCEALTDEQAFFLFAACYGLARHEVEESNWYYHAETLVRSSITALESMPDCRLLKVLEKFAAIQIDICTIDRGIYTSQEWLMQQATENIEVYLANVNALSNLFNDVEASIYSEYLLPEFTAYKHYSSGVKVVSDLYAIRWQDPKVLTAKMAQNKPLFLQAVDQLTQADKYIMSTDLESLWPPLDFFSEQRKPGTGELFIERGAISISYFATVSHNVSQEFRQVLSDIIDNRCPNHKLYFEQWNDKVPQRNMLNDIWSGISQDFADIYSWELPKLTMPFRDNGDICTNLEFDIELVYYPMGIFALNLKGQLDKVSASGVRHAMSLGTPFAMDQLMHWNGQQVGLFQEFADERFAEVASALHAHFDIEQTPGNALLHYNTVENRYVSTRLDRMMEYMNGEFTPVDAKALKAHIGYPAFVLPQRELRSAVDDWCLRTVTAEEHNLNKACYNRQEFVYTNRHECVLGLLEQPNWVLDQSAEMMDVAAVITNMFQLTNTELGMQLKKNQLSTTPAINGSKKQSAKVLKARIEVLKAERKSLKQFTSDAHWLLDLINAGSMMTFPDHTRMVKQVFEYMDFENLHSRTQDTLAKIQYRQDEIIAESARIYEQLQSRNTKRLTSVLSGSMALISVGALKDIFDILNGSNMGFVISGELQVSIVTLFALLLIILLINKNDNQK